MKAAEIKKLTYEQGMEKLEEMVRKLENGGMTLNESFDAYEDCIMLYKHLDAILSDGDARIMRLTMQAEAEMEN